MFQRDERVREEMTARKKNDDHGASNDPAQKESDGYGQQTKGDTRTQQNGSDDDGPRRWDVGPTSPSRRAAKEKKRLCKKGIAEYAWGLDDVPHSTPGTSF
jgi:hypothetical protein